jgi:hypothetical protein
VEIALNPAQLDIESRLRAPRDERPTYDAELRHHLRAQLEKGMIGPLAQLGPDRVLVVSKNRLTAVHGCEVRYLADEFSWSVAAARGRVAHKAVELSVHWRRELVPLVLVDEALARLENGDDDFARWLQGLDEAERAELRSEANDPVAKFLECWPPLRKGWRPVTEAVVRQDLLDERVVLRGKVDLTLGMPDGLVAGKVLIDLKTGGAKAAHLDDLRFYALVETLRLGTPPLRLGTYYLDQGRLIPEDVTEAMLETTVRRVVEGFEKMVELAAGDREPIARPSPMCRWCPVADGCDDGRAWLADDDARDW